MVQTADKYDRQSMPISTRLTWRQAVCIVSYVKSWIATNWKVLSVSSFSSIATTALGTALGKKFNKLELTFFIQSF